MGRVNLKLNESGDDDQNVNEWKNSKQMKSEKKRKNKETKRTPENTIATMYSRSPEKLTGSKQKFQVQKHVTKKYNHPARIMGNYVGPQCK